VRVCVEHWMKNNPKLTFFLWAHWRWSTHTCQEGRLGQIHTASGCIQSVPTVWSSHGQTGSHSDNSRWRHQRSPVLVLLTMKTMMITN